MLARAMCSGRPVLADCAFGEGSACVAAKLPALMKGPLPHVHPVDAWTNAEEAASPDAPGSPAMVGLVRGHGAFAVGETLFQCVGRLTMMENQCRLLYMRKLLEK